MQALFLFVLFGLFYAVLMGVMTTGSSSALQLKQAQVAGTHEFFADVEKVIQQRIVPENMYVADQGNTVTPYLSRQEIVETINWNYAPTTTQDPWGNNFTGYVVHQRVPVRAQQGGGQVQLPITAFVLVSKGPDRSLHPTLQARLNALTPTSQIRDVMNIEAVSNTDDIVRTFSTFKAVESRWQQVEDRVDELAHAASRQYTSDYFVFGQRLVATYGVSATDFYGDDGLLIDTPANRAQWVADNVGTTPADMMTYEDQDQLGTQGARDYIETKSNLRIRTEAYPTNTGIGSPTCTSVVSTPLSNALRICISNNGSPWGDSSGQLFYYKDITGEAG